MKGPESTRQGEPAAGGSPVDMKSAVALARVGLCEFNPSTTASEVALGELHRLLGA
jgi:hypothetical protein